MYIEHGVAVLELRGTLDVGGVDALDALLGRAWQRPYHGAVACDLTRLDYLSPDAARRLVELVPDRPACLAPVLLCPPSGQPARELAAADPGGRLAPYPTLAAALAQAVDPQRTPARSARLALGRERHEPRSARAFVGTVCMTWQLPDVLDDAALVTSELVTNAVVHAGGACELVIDLCRDHLTIAVRDGADTGPSLHASDPACDEGGRGLHLVEALACADGNFRLPGGGKVVWCTLQVPAHN